MDLIPTVLPLGPVVDPCRLLLSMLSPLPCSTCASRSTRRKWRCTRAPTSTPPSSPSAPTPTCTQSSRRVGRLVGGLVGWWAGGLAGSSGRWAVGSGSGSPKGPSGSLPRTLKSAAAPLRKCTTAAARRRRPRPLQENWCKKCPPSAEFVNMYRGIMQVRNGRYGGSTDGGSTGALRVGGMDASDRVVHFVGGRSAPLNASARPL